MEVHIILNITTCVNIQTTYSELTFLPNVFHSCYRLAAHVCVPDKSLLCLNMYFLHKKLCITLKIWFYISINFYQITYINPLCGWNHVKYKIFTHVAIDRSTTFYSTFCVSIKYKVDLLVVTRPLWPSFKQQNFITDNRKSRF